MNNSKVYDLIGIGIGPFNLGLAALASGIPGLECIFVDQQPSFNWHAGLMLSTAKMQVPFYADLVTLADPCSPYSYMAWLKAAGRLFRFAINESYFPYRSEFNEYCQWVASRLLNLHFGYRCEAVYFNPNKKWYEVKIRHTDTAFVQLLHGKHLVLGVGTVPHLPEGIAESKEPLIFHSSNYLSNKRTLKGKQNITLVGSGQSAAEIFLDLMQESDDGAELNWFTRSDGFHPMDYSKFALELSSPDYINYFFRLDSDKRQAILKNQSYLYKGINSSLISQIYEALYLKGLDKRSILPGLHSSLEMKTVDVLHRSHIKIEFQNLNTAESVKHFTSSLILATGYEYRVPDFLQPVHDRIDWLADGKYNVQKNYSIDRENTLFVQNADLHTHGFNSADIGLGPYRNAVILNTILGHENFRIESGSTFQNFK
jgi:lysine N6-hydroxylase